MRTRNTSPARAGATVLLVVFMMLGVFWTPGAERPGPGAGREIVE